MQFDDRELQFIKDQEFLLTKNSIIGKVHDLLAQTRTEIQSALYLYQLTSPSNKHFKNGKISRGENYRALPYLVLDYPAVYSKNDIFAFRTMFWWGNFFSSSFHIQGSFLDLYLPSLISQWQRLARDQFFNCVGDSPWEYHYGTDNYLPVSEKDRNLLDKRNFIKLGKKFALDQWNELPALSTKFVSDVLSVLQ